MADSDQNTLAASESEAGSASATADAPSVATPTSASNGDRPELFEGLRLHAFAGGARALAGHQSEELDFGGSGYLALEWGPHPAWGVQLEGGFIGLAGNDVQPPVGLEQLEASTGGQLGLGLRCRPFAPPESALDPAGLWISAAGGVSLTGGLVAPQFDAFLGYDFFITSQLALGPSAGYAHVFQADDRPRPDDAQILLFGLHLSFDLGARKPLGPVDTDGDGILDEFDQCIELPEDFDGYQDEDGCPELDNDEDGLNDIDDGCPLEPEDVDQFEDADGCPDPDNDEDGLLDSEDQCPLEPEDVDDYLDDDGCPDPDNDGDKIVDAKDLCPNEPEVFNGYSDNDGCPDTKSVRVVGDKIELDQKIHFWSNSSTIRAMSYPVLSKLAQFLKDHPEYSQVSIEGHADERGPDELNQKLSAARAASVRQFLIERGVSEARLSSRGFGEAKPLVDASNEHAWFMNRRVEFVVTRERKVIVTEDLKGPGRSQRQVVDMEPAPEATGFEDGAPRGEPVSPEEEPTTEELEALEEAAKPEYDDAGSTSSSPPEKSEPQ